jgi:hypothetical protein
MKIQLQAITNNKPTGGVARTKAVYSSASWQYNQTGQQYNQAGVQYGGSDRRNDLGPLLNSVSDL